MKTIPVIINADGLTGREKNPFEKTFYDISIDAWNDNPKWWDFEKSVKSYAIIGGGKAGSEIECEEVLKALAPFGHGYEVIAYQPIEAPEKEVTPIKKDININEQKASLFAMYFGQCIVQVSNGLSNNLQPITGYFLDKIEHFDNPYLLLRTIDQLTDEEWKEFKGKSLHGEQTYLRLIGVLTQFAYLDNDGILIWLSEQQLIDLNWVKLKTS